MGACSPRPTQSMAMPADCLRPGLQHWRGGRPSQSPTTKSRSNRKQAPLPIEHRTTSVATAEGGGGWAGRALDLGHGSNQPAPILVVGGPQWRQPANGHWLTTAGSALARRTRKGRDKGSRWTVDPTRRGPDPTNRRHPPSWSPPELRWRGTSVLGGWKRRGGANGTLCGSRHC